MRNIVQVYAMLLLLPIFLQGCTEKSSTGDLVCQLVAKEKQTCSSVLSLESGVLRFSEQAHSFELVADYDACFQTETLRITGDYKQHPHKSVFDLEMLATKIESKNNVAEQFSRTIGLVTLNNTSLNGRFVDIWATIRTHTQTVENLPKIDVSCRVDNKGEEK
ncbi:MAG TPA: hypothetical protein EYG68_04940 [Leucothrix mucor]|nr:hypothetical protein [Leucothrix mucor]